jgi:hypothetical protein
MDIASMLLAYPGLMAVRLVVGDEQDFVIKTDAGQLEISDNIFQGNITNLSMNLAGGLFDTGRYAHLRFLPSSGKAKRIWNGGYCSPKFYISNKFYKESPDCFGLCMPVAQVHDITFPFEKKFSSEKELNKFLAERGVNALDSDLQYYKRLILAFDRNKRTAIVPYRLKINHMPTMANYWHVTLDSYRSEDVGLEIIRGGKENSADKKMQKALKNHIKQ